MYEPLSSQRRAARAVEAEGGDGCRRDGGGGGRAQHASRRGRGAAFDCEGRASRRDERDVLPCCRALAEDPGETGQSSNTRASWRPALLFPFTTPWDPTAALSELSLNAQSSMLRAEQRQRRGRQSAYLRTSVRARGASRPRGEEHETTFAAAVEELPRRCLRRAPFSTAAFRIQTNPRCGRAG